MKLSFYSTLLEFIGGLLLMPFAASSLYKLFKENNLLQAQNIICQGAILSLNFKLAATILKLLFISNWPTLWQILIIVLLRKILSFNFK